MKASNLYLTLGTEVIYEDANFQLNNLDKVGVVGVNGAVGNCSGIKRRWNNE